jgi:HKD family nuclease
MNDLARGLYERLLDQELEELILTKPDLKAVLRSIDDETAPHLYSQYVTQLVYKALRITKSDQRILVVNRLIELLSAMDGLDFLLRKKLLLEDKNLLTEVFLQQEGQVRPVTPLSTSALLTGQGGDPTLEHELRAEIFTADSVDIIVSFIKWSGLRLLIPAFEHLRDTGVPVRILSTSYMGASDPAAIEWLAKLPNAQVRVSFDTGRTRLHAKAYHFKRHTGYSTAYIGSANMSHTAMTQGLEWTVKVTNQDIPHILARFEAEFLTYWESDEFEAFDEVNFSRFRKAINSYKQRSYSSPQFFAEITARPFQLRILEALEAARQNGSKRNLVVAATGTGKTVISALDYKRSIEASQKKIPLLFVVHRKEILEQALGCFRAVLRD